MLAATLTDLETLRIALDHRLRILTNAENVVDSDGKARGFGLDPSVPAVRTIMERLAEVTVSEHTTQLALGRVLRRHALYPWIKAQVGLGDKQVARLLGAIKDPYWNGAHGRPRTVSELWAYAGFKPGQRRRKGEQGSWSTDAKVRAYLIADKCIMFDGKPDKNGNPRPRSPYRDVYDRRRVATADRTHDEVCLRCGPSGKPAAVGTPWSAAHRHADALRVTAKALLRDLWSEARRLHEQSSSQQSTDAHDVRAAAPEPGTGQSTRDAQERTAGAAQSDSGSHKGCDAQSQAAAAVSEPALGHNPRGTQLAHAGGAQTDSGSHGQCDARDAPAAAVSDTPADQGIDGIQDKFVGGGPTKRTAA
jgi:hypothetical protein